MAARTKRKTKSRKKKQPAQGFLARLGGITGGFLLGQDVDEDTSQRLQEIKGLALIGLSVWILISLLSYAPVFDDPTAQGRNWGGQVGHYIATWIFMGMGLAGYMLVFLFLAWGCVLVTRKRVAWPGLRLFGGICFLISAGFLFELGLGETFDPRGPGARGAGTSLPFGAGGWLAMTAVPVLIPKFGAAGLWILMGLVTLLSFMLATEMAFYPAVTAMLAWFDERREQGGEGFGKAVWGWTKRLLGGLWDFIRGAEIGEAAAAAVKKKKGPVERQLELEAELYEDEEEDEEDEEDEWEYGYEDEDPEEEYDEYEEEEEEPETLKPAAKKTASKAAPPKVKTIDTSLIEPPTPPPGPWRFPPLDLLEPPGARTAEDEKAIEDAANKLEQALASFRVEAQVVGAKVGPTVTLFELEIVQGTRMNKVTQLSSEIAAALRARSVRIIAPIPGKSTIGIEVPNVGRKIVRMTELITQKAYDKKFAALPLFLGMDTEGKTVVEDLSRMPHLLIAGTTGSGKSVCINSILASLLLTRSPHDVQLILVDPKMVELQMFSQVPHMMLPVVTDARQATNVLLWACEKMEGRYELFKDAGVRNIKSYNSLGEDKLRELLGEHFNEDRTPRHVPHIVIVIDEMADLMLVSKKEAEQTITRLAQKSRAVGIHVIVATQRPSTDVITGVLKGNLPTRIAFQVASKVDSRVILDTMGAEKLLGQGDMLYTPPQSSQILRVQGALVEDHEIQSLVDFVCKESAPQFSQELVQAATGTAQAGAGGKSGAEEDDLWDAAVRVILKSRRGSASLLQRALGIGYTRASRLIDLMTAEGIVGEHKGSKAREVLLSLEDWEEMYGAPLGVGDSDD